MTSLGDKPQVLVVTDRLGEGLTNGAQVFANALLPKLAQWFDLTIVVGHSEHPDPCLADRIIVAPPQEDWDIGIPSAIMRMARLDQASLVYNLGGTTLSCSITERLVKSIPSVPLVNHFQILLDICAEYEGWNPEQASDLARSQHWLAGIAKRNLFPSHSEQATAISRWGCQNECSFVVPNAFVHADIGDDSPSRRSSFTFLAAGRFADSVKGADLLYRAFVRLHQEHPTVRLEIASGDERFLEILKPLPKASWQLLGWLDRADLLRHMFAVDIVVAPSRYEPFGMVAIEALATGTPVIAIAVGGLAEIICHNVTGWLCRPEEGSMGLWRLMDTTVRNRPWVLSMANDAQQVAHREYSLDRVADLVRAHLANTLNSVSYL